MFAPHGVEVVIVEPGAVRTEMVGRGGVTAKRLTGDMRPDHKQRYGGLIHPRKPSGFRGHQGWG